MPLRLILATALALGLTAAPAAAATLLPLKDCYVSAGRAEERRETVVVRGDAFAPRAPVDVLVDGVAIPRVTTGFVGEFEVFLPAPFQKSGERAFTITATDGDDVVTRQSRVTNLSVFVRPRTARPSRRVRFRGRGFILNRPVYGHYLFGGRLQKTVRIARRTHGACGTFRARRRQIPIDNPRTGRWTVQFDQHRTFSPKPKPVLVRLPIDVRETFAEGG